jgi:hypothetical protein
METAQDRFPEPVSRLLIANYALLKYGGRVALGAQPTAC